MEELATSTPLGGVAGADTIGDVGNLAGVVYPFIAHIPLERKAEYVVLSIVVGIGKVGVGLEGWHVMLGMHSHRTAQSSLGNAEGIGNTTRFSPAHVVSLQPYTQTMVSVVVGIEGLTSSKVQSIASQREFASMPFIERLGDHVYHLAGVL